MKIRTPVLLMMFFTLSAWVKAGDHSHEQEKGHSLEAHVHGVSELTIAMDGKDIEIEFESPAMNLLGFEHKAKSDKDKATVEKAVALLSKHESVFVVSGSSCKLVDSVINVSGVLEGHEKKPDPHKKHDSHDHDEHRHAESHSEVTARYHFQCDSNEIASMTVNLFKHFTGIHEINVMWLSETKQGAASLTSKNSTISFK